MSSQPYEDETIAIICVPWIPVNSGELARLGDCASLLAAMLQARAANRYGFQFAEASEVDMFYMCGSERPAGDLPTATWKPVLLLDLSYFGEEDRFVGVWLRPDIAKVLHATHALAVCASGTHSQHSVEASAEDFLALGREIARKTTEAHNV